jgi:hypothetical protein
MRILVARVMLLSAPLAAWARAPIQLRAAAQAAK